MTTIKDVEPVEVLWTDWKIYKRMPCEVYTRVMGYIRPVSWYNPWKKSEFYGRAAFEQSKIDNSAFLARYMTVKTLEK